MLTSSEINKSAHLPKFPMNTKKKETLPNKITVDLDINKLRSDYSI